MNEDAFKLVCQNCGSSDTWTDSWECCDCGTHTTYNCNNCGQRQDQFGSVIPGDPMKKVNKGP